MVVFFVCVWIWGLVQPEASSPVLSIGMRPRRSTAVSLDPAITSHTPFPRSDLTAQLGPCVQVASQGVGENMEDCPAQVILAGF